jgi:hypothetical protein
MGWYVKCDYCGESEKYCSPDCNCMLINMAQTVQKRKNATVVDAFFHSDNFASHMYEKLSTENGEVFYTCFMLRNNSYEEGLFLQPIVETDKTNFVKMAKSFRLDEDNFFNGGNEEEKQFKKETLKIAALVKSRIGQKIESSLLKMNMSYGEYCVVEKTEKTCFRFEMHPGTEYNEAASANVIVF